MKVNIGPYRGGLINFGYIKHKFYSIDQINDEYENLPIGLKIIEKLENAFRSINRWYENKKERKIQVRIDDYDCWSLDHTLATIIHPALIKLKENKMGSPHVDNEDAPVHLQTQRKDLYEIDDMWHDRWEWVISEMIWAFDQIKNEYSADQFHHNAENSKLVTEETENGLYELKCVDIGSPKYYYDKDAHQKHEERISNGLRLFGKYYRGLWD